VKLLYLSCHAVLEYDELSLFHELGVDVFSTGAYLEPNSPSDPGLRPPLTQLTYAADDVEAFHAMRAEVGEDRYRLTSSFVDRFDAVMIMHVPEWVTDNWDVLRDKPTIWRSIGQSSSEVERKLQPSRAESLKIVRYSPHERNLPDYCGEDAVIRFYKNGDEFPPWQGDRVVVMNLTQAMPSRGRHCNYELFRDVVAPFGAELYGPGNEDAGELCKGQLSYQALMQTLARARSFFYTGTYPACYTLGFIEAWMAGTPIVAIGRECWEIDAAYSGELYEIPDLITHGTDGFVCDDLADMRQSLRRLLDDEEIARQVSNAARVAARNVFGKETIAQQWQEFFAAI